MRFLIESISAEQNEHITDFYRFVREKLDIRDRPVLSFVPSLHTTSFGVYSPSHSSVTVATEGRHISDILRTFAHELVHHKQITTNSPLSLEELEYEANAVAGMLMREYNKMHPEMFGEISSEPLPAGSIADGGIDPGQPMRPPYPIEMGESMNSIGSGNIASVGVGVYGEPGIDFEVDIDNEDNDWNHTHDHIHSLHRHHQNVHHRQRAETKARHTFMKQWKKDHTDMHITEELVSELSNQTLAAYKKKAKSEIRSTNDGTFGIKYFNRQYFRNQDLATKRKTGIDQATLKLKARYSSLEEDAGAVVNSAGSGAVAGIGVGPQGEPGIQKKKKTPMFKRKSFTQLREELKGE